MGGKSVQRGKSWERAMARDLSDATGLGVSRVLRETRDGNAGDVRGPGVLVQRKAGAKPRSYDALAEAVEAAGFEELAFGAIKRMNGRGRPADRFAVVPWSDFVELVAKGVKG